MSVVADSIHVMTYTRIAGARSASYILLIRAFDVWKGFIVLSVLCLAGCGACAGHNHHEYHDYHNHRHTHENCFIMMNELITGIWTVLHISSHHISSHHIIIFLTSSSHRHHISSWTSSSSSFFFPIIICCAGTWIVRRTRWREAVPAAAVVTVWLAYLAWLLARLICRPLLPPRRVVSRCLLHSRDQHYYDYYYDYDYDY